MSGNNSVAASATRTKNNRKKEADIDSSLSIMWRSIESRNNLRKKKCFFCGRTNHRRANCPAKEVSCHSCGKVRHFSHVCWSKGTKSTKKPSVGQTSALSSRNSCHLYAGYAAASPGSLIKSFVAIFRLWNKVNCFG